LTTWNLTMKLSHPLDSDTEFQRTMFLFHQRELSSARAALCYLFLQ